MGVEFQDIAAQDMVEDPAFVLEMPVDQGFVHPGRAGDFRRGDGGEALFLQKGLQGVGQFEFAGGRGIRPCLFF